MKALGALVSTSLEKANIPIKVPIEQIITKRSQAAYPIYKNGWGELF